MPASTVSSKVAGLPSWWAQLGIPCWVVLDEGWIGCLSSLSILFGGVGLDALGSGLNTLLGVVGLHGVGVDAAESGL